MAHAIKFTRETWDRLPFAIFQINAITQRQSPSIKILGYAINTSIGQQAETHQFVSTLENVVFFLPSAFIPANVGLDQ